MTSTSRLALLISAGSLLAISSCSTGGKSPSGFLGNYGQMNTGEGTADAVTAYVKPGADLKKYDSVIIDPVTTVIAAPGIAPEISEELAAYLAESLVRQVGGHLRVTSVPGPTTLRVRAALTDVIEGREAGKPVKTLHVGARSKLTGSLGSAELASFVSHVSFEGEVLDSQSGERLAALMDHRLGVKREATPATSWAAVRSGINQGVIRLRDRFLTVSEE